ncbi:MULTISPECIES: trypsin-like peptidase domain-containing protein [unclassified Micromonospora]|uniref:S1C family serine protease n=1 Tax=unclassified Micromonospora TaxID=2617518 RepID=UPI001C230291|nr:MULTISPECIES: trypsin-like peptidase domain-containing protein [unclassified Micromonospora]MBU8861644.1 trypsin-like peptidase domain-containing protein [Micromonospora sp. WMMB482]MDM4781213.1 trypsin-like peptidase domain-containing protein [Micromonospora sp. b486]
MERRRRRATLIGSVALLAVTLGCTADGDATATPAEKSTVSAAPPAAGLPQVVARLQPSVVTVRTDQGLGSGVVFRDGGLVLTNEHVVGDQRDVELALADGTRVPARVVAADAVTDLAVLRAERTDLPPAPLRTELPAPGEPVVALGSPLGFLNSVTAGIVSGVGREIPGSASQGNALVDLIQTDAAISPGNSGGALADYSGRVVGINDAYLPPQTGAVSIGFAIPVATAVDIADDLLDDGKVTQPYLGLAVTRLTAEIARSLGAATDRGVLVRDVAGDGPAAAAGLRPGDIITGLAGDRTDTLEAFLGALRGVEPGQRVPVTYLRGSDSRSTTVTPTAATR